VPHERRGVLRRAKAGSGGGKSKLISLDSMEMQVVADSIEVRLGLTQTVRLVNEHRRECGLEDVGQLPKSPKSATTGKCNLILLVGGVPEEV